jgi:hypothetical protein
LNLDKSINKLSERLNNLYPNSLQITHWKGKKIISVEEWQQISGLSEIYAREKEIESRPEVKGSLKIKLDYPEDAWKEITSMKREFKKEALEYFPDGLIPVALLGFYTCPEAEGDEFNVWVSEFKDLLLKLKGIDESDYVHDDTFIV